MIELKLQLLSKVCCYSVRLTTRILILTLLIFPVQSCTNHFMNNGCSNQIAFVSKNANEKNSDIYLVNLDGSGLKNLTNSSAYETTPSWSPDGQKIAFSSNRDGNPEIYVMNFDGSHISRLTQTQQGMNYSPAWSPDGKKIAFISIRNNNIEIYTVNLNDLKQDRITQNNIVETSVAWSPKGEEIAFSASDGSVSRQSSIYVLNITKNKLSRLTANNEYSSHPSWSPDGSKIAYYFGSNNGTKIYVVNIDGSSKKSITGGIATDGYPGWSPNGEQIIFSNSDSGTHIYVMQSDGSKRIQVTSQLVDGLEARSLFPIWRPVFCRTGIRSRIFLMLQNHLMLLLLLFSLGLDRHQKPLIG